MAADCARRCVDLDTDRFSGGASRRRRAGATPCASSSRCSPGATAATPAARAVEKLQAGGRVRRGRTLLERSARAWAARWATADVEIAGDAETQRRHRFAIYHLIGCANPEDEYASPGARSLTGERYKGHVFWDTEIFVLPFFVYTHPPTARALLMYRYHTLAAARDKAGAMGFRGALFAWESTDTGADVTPPFVYNSAGERLEILTGSAGAPHLGRRRLRDLAVLAGHAGRGVLLERWRRDDAGDGALLGLAGRCAARMDATTS